MKCVEGTWNQLKGASKGQIWDNLTNEIITAIDYNPQEKISILIFFIYL